MRRRTKNIAGFIVVLIILFAFIFPKKLISEIIGYMVLVLLIGSAVLIVSKKSSKNIQKYKLQSTHSEILESPKSEISFEADRNNHFSVHTKLEPVSWNKEFLVSLEWRRFEELCNT